MVAQSPDLQTSDTLPTLGYALMGSSAPPLVNDHLFVLAPSLETQTITKDVAVVPSDMSTA